MTVSLAYALATLVVCFSGSAGGGMFAVGVQMKSSGLAIGGIITLVAGMAFGASIYGIGNLIAWGCGL